MPLSLAEFVERWKAVTLTERAAAQSHFIDLCEVLGQARPALDRVRAVNGHGGFGTWASDVSRYPSDIHEILQRHGA